ncbi:hypothetical protein AB1E33_25775 [Ruegeria sp. 2012CJ15-1]
MRNRNEQSERHQILTGPLLAWNEVDLPLAHKTALMLLTMVVVASLIGV